LGHQDTDAKKAASSEPGPRAIRFANAVTSAAIVLALSQVAFGLQLDRPRVLWASPLAFALLLLATRRLRPAHRVTLALTLSPVIPLVYGFEWRIARARPYDATAAERAGRPFDTRSLWEAIRDARREGVDAYPSLHPRTLLVLDLKTGITANENQNHALSPEWGVLVNGERVLPLAGVSRKHIIHCNEDGRRASYPSDEHGFNNPAGIWPRDTLDVALIGDSFTHGACVGADETTAHWIRQRYPATLSLGMPGNGPLLELASLEEYVAPKRPKVVLWVYYSNDMSDLDFERTVPLLRRYLDEDGFTQGLAQKQAAIDEALIALSARVEAFAPRWPGWLETLGVARGSGPVWFGDLVMRETHSSTTAVLRLDRLAGALGSRFVVDYLHVAPDLPLFERVLTRARSRVASWGGKMYFVYLADLFHLDDKGKHEHHNRRGVLAAAQQAGLPIIDLHPVFLAQGDPSAIRAHRESHCNAAGYKLIADVVLRSLEGG
jgi:hypothetical protein